MKKLKLVSIRYYYIILMGVPALSVLFTSCKKEEPTVSIESSPPSLEIINNYTGYLNESFNTAYPEVSQNIAFNVTKGSNTLSSYKVIMYQLNNEANEITLVDDIKFLQSKKTLNTFDQTVDFAAYEPDFISIVDQYVVKITVTDEEGLSSSDSLIVNGDTCPGFGYFVDADGPDHTYYITENSELPANSDFKIRFKALAKTGPPYNSVKEIVVKKNGIEMPENYVEVFIGDNFASYDHIVSLTAPPNSGAKDTYSFEAIYYDSEKKINVALSPYEISVIAK